MVIIKVDRDLNKIMRANPNIDVREEIVAGLIVGICVAFAGLLLLAMIIIKTFV